MPIREHSGLAVSASPVPGCVPLSSHPPGNILQEGVGVAGGLPGHPCRLLPPGAPRMGRVSTGHVDSASFNRGGGDGGSAWLVSVWATQPPPPNPLPGLPLFAFKSHLKCHLRRHHPLSLMDALTSCILKTLSFSISSLQVGIREQGKDGAHCRH